MDYKTKFDIGAHVCFSNNHGVKKGLIVGIRLDHAFGGDEVPSHRDRSHRNLLTKDIVYSVLVSVKKSGAGTTEYVCVVPEGQIANTLEDAWELVSAKA